ncbi:MAG: DUF1566 domain-containing protein [Deltaproteobacteria bacterium]|nr:DUF1566 domain-containing protein [Deltaproteobacteria bacterium]
MHFRLSCIAVVLLLSMLQGCAATSGKQGSSTFIDLGNGIFQIPGSSLMWQKEKSPLLESGEEALQYVKNLDLGGYRDWRLPTPDEVLALHHVIDFGKAKEGDQGIHLKGDYWCEVAEDTIMAGSWQDKASCELTRFYTPNYKGYVRAVRP